MLGSSVNFPPISQQITSEKVEPKIHQMGNFRERTVVVNQEGTFPHMLGVKTGLGQGRNRSLSF